MGGNVSAAVPHAVAERGKNSGGVFVIGCTGIVRKTVAPELIDSQLRQLFPGVWGTFADQPVDCLLRRFAVKERRNQLADTAVTLNQSEESVV